MAIAAGDILDRARRILIDETSRRWPLPELARWLNDGIVELIVHKPSEGSGSVVMGLVEGTRQEIPAGYSQFLAAVRNIRDWDDEWDEDVDGAQPRVSGRVITAVDRQEIDDVQPGWHDTDVIESAQAVQHFIFDPKVPREFYVYPANDGTGFIEVALASIPAAIATTSTVMADYDAQSINIDTIWRNAMVDYVCYRAFNKNSQAGSNAQKAAAHYTQFANSIGLKLANEMRAYPNRSAKE